MSVVIDGTLGITSPAETVQGALTTTGNTILGDASTDTLNVGNGGLVKDASGNVGIGTTNPSQKFVVSNAGAAGLEISPTAIASSPCIISYNRSGAAYTQLQTSALLHVWDTSGTERMRITSTGVMYLGPLATNFSFTNGSAVDTAGSGTGLAGTATNLTLGVWNGPMVFQAGNSAGALQERMRISSSGNVGIGTTVNNVYDQVASARPLVVQKSDTNTTLNGSLANITIVNGDTTTNNTAQLNFAAITGASTNQYSSASISTIFGARTNTVYPSGILTFSTSAATQAPAERMRIDSSGNVGIGNVAPTQKLDVTGNATVSGTVTSTGLVTSGVRAHNGMYEASIRWSNDSPNAKTYKIAKFSTAYWGDGAYTIEVWKTYYDNFGYAKYIISGHTFTAYSPAMSLVTVSTTGTVTPVSLSGIIAIDAQGGYVNLIVTNPSYGGGRIKITSPANLIQTTNANISHNECYIYPENTVN